MDIKERFYANLDLIREEAEQLDELTKKTMRSYKHKAAADRVNNSSDNKIVNKRTKGINLALSRLSKKSKFDLEEEQLDEAGLGMKRFKKAFRGTGPEGTGDPRPMKKRLKDDPEHAKEIASRTGKLGGMAELQRRIAKRMVNKNAKVKEEAEQLDVKKKSDKKDKLFFRSRKMIAVSKLDRNRIRNKDNRKD